MAVENYILLEEVTKLFNNAKHGVFTVFQLNLQSACNKQDELSTFVNSFGLNFDVLLFTETWYFEEGDVIDLENYRPFYLNCSGKHGGEVSLHIKDGIECELFEQFSVITEY